MNKKSERYGTCKDCKTPDSFLFSEKRCRQCHYDARDGKEPGSTVLARRAAQAEKASKSKKRGKTKSEQAKIGVEQTSATINHAPAQEPIQRTECEHLVALHNFAPFWVPVHIGETIEHSSEDLSGIQLFTFCPLCGKQLNLTRTTNPASFQTVFQEADNG